MKTFILLYKVYDICKQKGISEIGIESHISHNQFLLIQKLFKYMKVTPYENFIIDLKMIKTENEILLMKEATLLSDKCYLELLIILRWG